MCIYIIYIHYIYTYIHYIYIHIIYHYIYNNNSRCMITLSRIYVFPLFFHDFRIFLYLDPWQPMTHSPGRATRAPRTTRLTRPRPPKATQAMQAMQATSAVPRRGPGRVPNERCGMGAGRDGEWGCWDGQNPGNQGIH